MKKFIRWCALMVKAKPGDWMEEGGPVGKRAKNFVAGAPKYDPDAEFEALKEPAPNPILQFQEALKEGKCTVREAYVWEGQVDETGKLRESKGTDIPYRTRRVVGTQDYLSVIKESEQKWAALPAKAQKAREALRRLAKRGLKEQAFNQDNVTVQYDLMQYTEYAPLYSGPFNKQLYLTDYLTMHARSFEAKNHNPLAKRIVDVLAQYAFGRRFKVRAVNAKIGKIWDEFDAEHNITHKLSEFWSREYLTYGELMINKAIWQSVDPSTVWDIITDPDDITNVYYYYQQYSTAFQTFTGYRVPGAPGSQNAKPLEYIIREIPAKQMIHIKGNVLSQEKRGRSILFPILGWLKRMKDLYNAEVTRAQLQASFVWDVTITGDASDVAAYANAYSGMPAPASTHVHNEQVKREPMPAMTAGERAGGGVSDEILAFIATAVGIPKEFFNVLGPGAGSRVGGLVGAEPFEKVVEELQAKGEYLLHEIASDACLEAGVEYKKGDLEFIFPSVTKDTTSETVKNIAMGESMEYIDHQTASEMFAAELNITTYDYEKSQEEISKWKTDHPTPMMPPNGRFGFGGNPEDDEEQQGGEVHGEGKAKAKKAMNKL